MDAGVVTDSGADRVAKADADSVDRGVVKAGSEAVGAALAVVDLAVAVSAVVAAGE